MTSPTRQILLRQRAKRAALLLECQQQSDRRVVEEENRRNDIVAKTARLRVQRLARDAAEADEKGRGPGK
jgi:hypothetical protein